MVMSRERMLAMSPIPQRSHETKMLILLEMICDKSEWRTMLEMARQMDYATSRTIRAPLDDLLQRGLIERREVPRPNGSIRFEFRGTEPGCDKLEQLKREGFL